MTKAPGAIPGAFFKWGQVLRFAFLPYLTVIAGARGHLSKHGNCPCIFQYSMRKEQFYNLLLTIQYWCGRVYRLELSIEGLGREVGI